MSRVALLAALLLFGCSTGAPGAATTSPFEAPTTTAPTPTDMPATTAPTAAPTPLPTEAPVSAEPTAAAADTVTLADDGYLVGPNGLSLYTFDIDEPGTSNCEGDCLANWPPLTVEDASDLTVAEGLDETSLGTITRSDGTLQVTLDDMPLYYFIGDSDPGDTNGDGVNDVWHLATAEAGTSGPPGTPDPYDYYDEY